MKEFAAFTHRIEKSPPRLLAALSENTGPKYQHADVSPPHVSLCPGFLTTPFTGACLKIGEITADKRQAVRFVSLGPPPQAVRTFSVNRQSTEFILYIFDVYVKFR